jgi:ankyrin repeat protein
VSDDEDMTPLLTAIKGKHLALASYLLQHGADPNDVLVDEKTSKAHNLLMDAVVDGNQELAILLVEKGANLTYVDEEGVTIITQVRNLIAAKSLFSVVVYMSVPSKNSQ